MIHQLLYFVQTFVAGWCQCTAVLVANKEASTETFNDDSAGERPLLLANTCSIKRLEMVAPKRK